MKKVFFPGIVTLHALFFLLVLVRCNRIEDPFYKQTQEPVITKVFEGSTLDSRYYFLAVQNLSKDDTANAVFINGLEVKTDSVFRQGSAEYDLAPSGEKIITRFYVDQSVGYVAVMDFTVSVNGIKSDAYRYINDPRIDLITSKIIRNEIHPGDTAIIGGRYLGSLKEGSVVELWDSLEQKHYTPDPEILSWNDQEIKMIIPDGYSIPAGTHYLRLKLQENGKEAKAFVRYAVPCPALDEVYTGEYRYPNQAGQPYGIQLFPDGTMDFSSSYDDYPGTYTYDCTSGRVTMDFAGHGVIVKAIREGNALTHFTFVKSSGFNFLNGDLNTTWDQNLDGTTWNDTATSRISLNLEFKAGSQVSIKGRNEWYPYVRQNGTIRFTISDAGFFGYIENNKMELSLNGAIYHLKKE